MCRFTDVNVYEHPPRCHMVPASKIYTSAGYNVYALQIGPPYDRVGLCRTKAPCYSRSTEQVIESYRIMNKGQYNSAAQVHCGECCNNPQAYTLRRSVGTPQFDSLRQTAAGRNIPKADVARLAGLHKYVLPSSG